MMINQNVVNVIGNQNIYIIKNFIVGIMYFKYMILQINKTQIYEYLLQNSINEFYILSDIITLLKLLI